MNRLNTILYLNGTSVIKIMFGLKSFFKKNETDVNSLDDSTKNYLIASILIECAKGDNNFSADEKTHIKSIFLNKLKLNSEQIETIFDRALADTKDNIELYSLVKEIREEFEQDEILKIFQYMWEIMLIDQKIDDFESALMRTAAGLFHISGKQSAEAKKAAEESIKNQN